MFWKSICSQIKQYVLVIEFPLRLKMNCQINHKINKIPNHDKSITEQRFHGKNVFYDVSAGSLI